MQSLSTPGSGTPGWDTVPNELNPVAGADASVYDVAEAVAKQCTHLTYIATHAQGSPQGVAGSRQLSRLLGHPAMVDAVAGHDGGLDRDSVFVALAYTEAARHVIPDLEEVAGRLVQRALGLGVAPDRVARLQRKARAAHVDAAHAPPVELVAAARHRVQPDTAPAVIAERLRKETVPAGDLRTTLRRLAQGTPRIHEVWDHLDILGGASLYSHAKNIAERAAGRPDRAAGFLNDPEARNLLQGAPHTLRGERLWRLYAAAEACKWDSSYARMLIGALEPLLSNVPPTCIKRLKGATLEGYQKGLKGRPDNITVELMRLHSRDSQRGRGRGRGPR